MMYQEISKKAVLNQIEQEDKFQEEEIAEVGGVNVHPLPPRA
jgi:hypothetical protein